MMTSSLTVAFKSRQEKHTESTSHSKSLLNYGESSFPYNNVNGMIYDNYSNIQLTT